MTLLYDDSKLAQVNRFVRICRECLPRDKLMIVALATCSRYEWLCAFVDLFNQRAGERMNDQEIAAHAYDCAIKTVPQEARERITSWHTKH